MECGAKIDIAYGSCLNCLAKSLCNPESVLSLLRRNDELQDKLRHSYCLFNKLWKQNFESGTTAKRFLEEHGREIATWKKKRTDRRLYVNAGDWFRCCEKYGITAKDDIREEKSREYATRKKEVDFLSRS
jgi:hypothetical protein